MLFAQVELPPSDSGPGGLWQSIAGPLAEPLSGLWWFVLHVVVPGALVLGIAGLVFAAITGNQRSMQRARGVFLAVPLALVLAGVATLVANWAIGAYT